MTIKIAIIKFGGLAAGGTEKLVQSLAANLNKDKFTVDYYWCHGAPYIGSDFKFPPTSYERLEYMKSRNVNLIEFNVEYKDVTNPVHPWVGTNFWEKFNEKNYDVVISGRAGHSEYPFHLINDTPIIDVISLAGHVDRQPNIVKSIHISEWQKDIWIKSGGNPNIAEVIPIFDELTETVTDSFRKDFSIPDDTFVFGFHQRAEPTIFSPVPIEAYEKIEKQFRERVAFVLLGGSHLHREQAKNLKIKNIKFIDHTGDPATIGKFLNTLNVYTHGRKDGETAGLAIIEAMKYGLPTISHFAASNGHVETIGDAGKVCASLDEYIDEMKSFLLENDKFLSLSKKAVERYQTHFQHKKCIGEYEKIIEEVYFANKEKKYSWNKIEANDDWLMDWVEE